MQTTVFTDAKLKPELFGDSTYLIPFALRFVHSHYFLQSNNVGLSLLYYVDNAVRPHALVKAATLVDVVSCDSK